LIDVDQEHSMKDIDGENKESMCQIWCSIISMEGLMRWVHTAQSTPPKIGWLSSLVELIYKGRLNIGI